MTAPKLPFGCKSWIVLDRETGKPMLETFNQNAADVYSQHDQVEVVTTLDWLTRYRKAVVLNNGHEPTKAQLDACR